MEMIIDGLGHPRSYSWHLLQIGHSGTQDTGQAAKVRQQCPAPCRSESGYGLEHRFAKSTRATPAVTGNRKAVRLIADALDQVQHRTVGGQAQGMCFTRKMDALLPHPSVGSLRHRGEAKA